MDTPEDDELWQDLRKTPCPSALPTSEKLLFTQNPNPMEKVLPRFEQYLK